MALIDKTVLLGIADRAAFQYQTLSESIDALNATGGGNYFSRVTVTNDVDVETATVKPYNSVDKELTNSGKIIRASSLTNVVSVMEAHFAVRDSNGDALQVGGWDGYLTTQDERVSGWFNLLHYDAKGYYMLARNVFSHGDDTLATIDVPLSFTDGINYGTGDDTNTANNGNYAATQLKVVVVSMGFVSLDIQLGVKDINNNPATVNVSVPGGSAAGTEISIGTSSDRFLDVFNVSVIGGGGTSGDQIEIRNLQERTIAL